MAPSSERQETEDGNWVMGYGALHFRAICVAFVACVGLGLSDFSAFGQPSPSFPYEFGADTASQDDRRAIRENIAFSGFPIVVDARDGSIAPLAYSALSEQVSVQLGEVPDGALWGEYGFSGYPLGQLSLRPISEPVVPEPSAIFGGFLAAGLIIAFLIWTRRKRISGSNA